MPVILTTSGVVQEWPIGFTAELPDEGWMVVHALPRQEKLLAGNLRRLGVPGMLFLERRVRRYPGKGTQEHLVPLIGGYLFVVHPEDRRDDIYRTERVVRIIMARRGRELKRDLLALKLLVENAVGPLVVRPELVAGRRVVLRHGTFAGCMGVISRRQGHTELVVNLELLGHSVGVRLQASHAELAEAVE